MKSIIEIILIVYFSGFAVAILLHGLDVYRDQRLGIKIQIGKLPIPLGVAIWSILWPVTLFQRGK